MLSVVRMSAIVGALCMAFSVLMLTVAPLGDTVAPMVVIVIAILVAALQYRGLLKLPKSAVEATTLFFISLALFALAKFHGVDQRILAYVLIPIVVLCFLNIGRVILAELYR
jgi:hypothetical protein